MLMFRIKKKRIDGEHIYQLQKRCLLILWSTVEEFNNRSSAKIAMSELCEAIYFKYIREFKI